jgi:hypothetical protein
MQTQFGQGTQGKYDATSPLSWGEKNNGQTQTKTDGSTFAQNYNDNIGNFFGTGLASNQGISLQQQYKSTSVYTSYNRLDDKSYIPGAKLIRNNLMARTVSKFGMTTGGRLIQKYSTLIHPRLIARRRVLTLIIIFIV